jgi:uncharacterized protein YndB with AHSA1/START domain
VIALINVELVSEIQTKAENLWDILVDINNWPQWQGTPFVNPITPLPIKEGSLFEVNLGGLKWKIKVLQAARPEKLSWIATSLGLKAVHEWDFQEQEGKTLVTTKESISGWSAFPLYFLVRSKVRSVDEKWLADLKTRAESS